VALILFACFAFGLPLWAMQNNAYERDSVHRCTGECFEQWQQETGGIVAMAKAQAAAKAAASPEELGKMTYAGCIACHGAQGEGGIGPQLAGQPTADIAMKLMQYKNGETLGAQSNLMWSQAAQLSESDIDNLAAYITTL
jgi:cytochrome c553